MCMFQCEPYISLSIFYILRFARHLYLSLYRTVNNHVYAFCLTIVCLK